MGTRGGGRYAWGAGWVGGGGAVRDVISTALTGSVSETIHTRSDVDEWRGGGRRGPNRGRVVHGMAS
jgi:hypothetical protein